jgi:hypothetical protein
VHPNDEVQDARRVTFGDAPGNSLTLPVVELMLRMWHEREPEVMGAYIAEAITGAKPRTRAQRRV